MGTFQICSIFPMNFFATTTLHCDKSGKTPKNLSHLCHFTSKIIHSTQIQQQSYNLEKNVQYYKLFLDYQCFIIFCQISGVAFITKVSFYSIFQISKKLRFFNLGKLEYFCSHLGQFTNKALVVQNKQEPLHDLVHEDIA